MPRIHGLEKNQAPWYLRWFYGLMRKMSGKDLTPAKIQMRLPGIDLGRHCDGSSTRPKATRFPPPHSIGKSAHSRADWLSILNRYQFCRGQKNGSER
jgi:hypothetical protein